MKCKICKYLVKHNDFYICSLNKTENDCDEYKLDSDVVHYIKNFLVRKYNKIKNKKNGGYE